jgi:hypothetical protein
MKVNLNLNVFKMDVSNPKIIYYVNFNKNNFNYHLIKHSFLDLHFFFYILIMVLYNIYCNYFYLLSEQKLILFYVY